MFAGVALGASDCFEFGGGGFALGAVGRCFIAFVDITANGAYILHDFFSFYFEAVCDSLFCLAAFTAVLFVFLLALSKFYNNLTQEI